MKSCRLLCRKMIIQSLKRSILTHERRVNVKRTLKERWAKAERMVSERTVNERWKKAEWNWLSGCERRAHAKREGSANRNARWTVNARWTLDDRFVRITSEVIPWLLFKQEYILKSYALFSTNVCKNRRRANARQSSSDCLNWHYSRFFFCTALWVHI